jgi:hypothetical protein
MQADQVYGPLRMARRRENAIRFERIRNQLTVDHKRQPDTEELVPPTVCARGLS